MNTHKVGGKFYAYKFDVGGKRFYAGAAFGIDSPNAKNERRAEKVQRAYSVAWDVLRSTGATAWTAASLTAAKASALASVGVVNEAVAVAEPLALPSGASEPPPPTPSRPNVQKFARNEEKPSVDASTEQATDRPRLHAAIDRFIAAQKARAASNQITAIRADTITYAIRRFKLYAEDCYLSDWTKKDCQDFINHFAGRPIQASGKKMAPDTAIDTITMTRAFFSDLADNGEWTPPGDITKLFYVNRKNLSTEAEKDKALLKTFTPDELISLYKFCNNERATLYFLLALNCGFTQKEIATLRLAHIRDAETGKNILELFDGKNTRPPVTTVYIKRRRNKTEVWGKWRLWPETAKLLQRNLAPVSETKNPHGLALLSEEGNPLLGKTERSRYDLVRGFWKKQVAAAITGAEKSVGKGRVTYSIVDGKPKATQLDTDYAKTRPLGFKYLRKTASNMIRKIGGKDCAECFLAHTDKTTGRVYHAPDFKRLRLALKKLHKQLKPMFDAKVWQVGTPSENYTIRQRAKVVA